MVRKKNLISALGKGHTRPQKAKMGHKTDKLSKQQNKQLRELFLQDGITPWRASIEVKCGYEYAVKKFREFGQELVDKEDESWIDRNDRVRKRTLEGLSIKINTAKDYISQVKARLERTREIQESIIDGTVQTIQDSEIGQLLDKIDKKIVFEIFQVLSKDLHMYKEYGTLVENIQRQLQSERTLELELQNQYAVIEILPPPAAVLEAEIEKSIAAKNELFSQKPSQETKI